MHPFFTLGGHFQGGIYCTFNREGIWHCFSWRQECFHASCCFRLGQGWCIGVNFSVRQLTYFPLDLVSWNDSFWWNQVREQGQQKDANPYLKPLQDAEEQAKQQGLGRWSRVCFSLTVMCFCYWTNIVNFTILLDQQQMLLTSKQYLSKLYLLLDGWIEPGKMNFLCRLEH